MQLNWWAYLAISFSYQLIYSETIHPVVIIGGGPAAYSAAVCTANAKLAPIVIEGTAPGGQPVKAGEIRNWPGITEINGAELVTNIQEHAKSLGAQIVEAEVIKINLKQKPYEVHTKKQKFLAHTVVIATGSEPVKINCPGEQEYFGKGIIVCAKCDGYLFENKPIVIVGGGYSALRELGLMLKHTKQITLINPDAGLSGPQFLVSFASDPNVTIMHNTEIKRIIGDGEKVTGVEILDKNSNQTKNIPTSGVLVGLGWKPNNALFKNQLSCNQNGEIVVTNNVTTTLPGVYAAGDVASSTKHQLFIAAGRGYEAGMAAEKYLVENELIRRF